MSKYEFIIYWSEADQSFVAEVPELPGCMADGATYGEAVANAERVIAEWLQTARELGVRFPPRVGDSNMPDRPAPYISSTRPAIGYSQSNQPPEFLSPCSHERYSLPSGSTTPSDV